MNVQFMNIEFIWHELTDCNFIIRTLLYAVICLSYLQVLSLLYVVIDEMFIL